jgi:hypothetical protein
VCILQLKSIFPLADIWRHQVLSAEAPQGKATWVGVDFGSSCTASITSVGFAHGSNVSRDHVLGSFLFQGSNDGKKWITLQEVMREKASVTYCGWSLPQAHNPLRYFRIMMTSPKQPPNLYKKFDVTWILIRRWNALLGRKYGS